MSVTLEDCGKELGISRERVRQIENRALEKIRSMKMVPTDEALSIRRDLMYIDHLLNMFSYHKYRDRGAIAELRKARKERRRALIKLCAEGRAEERFDVDALMEVVLHKEALGATMPEAGCPRFSPKQKATMSKNLSKLSKQCAAKARRMGHK